METADPMEGQIRVIGTSERYKKLHPFKVAEYARAQGIDNEPAFARWVPYMLRKRDVILSSVKARIRKTTHEYRIEIPSSLPHTACL
eukprot:13173892-Ditylum_brightwellii.AAC.2